MVQSCPGKQGWVSSFLTLLFFQGCQKENRDATLCCPMQTGKKKPAWMSTIPALRSPKEGDYSHLQAGPRDSSPGQAISLQLPRKKKQHKPLWENHVGSEEAQSCTASGTPDSQRDSLRCLNNQEHEGTHTHTDSQSLSSVFFPLLLKNKLQGRETMVLTHYYSTSTTHRQTIVRLMCRLNRCKA